MKKSTLVCVLLLLCFFTQTITVTASVSEKDVTVIFDGETLKFEQKPIIVEGRVLVPLRDICEKLGADVEWESSTQSITITKDSTSLNVSIGSRMMYINNNRYPLYLDAPPQIVNGRTVMPIRAVVEELGGEVQWDETERTVSIIYDEIISVPGVRNTQAWGANNWANVSSVQQFLYKNEGLAFAYVMGNNLEIVTPGNQITIKMEYPKLGDVISDDIGNFYIVWGKDGSRSTDQTVFISKYSSAGTHIKTTGFTGVSVMGDSGNTQYPFSYGNCVSAIGNGYLMVNYARSMYNGHQSNNVVGVRMSDMSPMNWNAWDIPYTSHSFNQSVIWSNITNGFLYADHGDAFSRGFVITSGRNEKRIFSFYMEANANYNMWIVNKTFAQMGGLVETSKGVALVGVSAKSISEAAKTEKQNLFIQIFNPLANEVSSSMFIGGVTRSGSTSFNIYDNNNSPLTRVTDYGVRWLTDYTDTDAIAPQAVIANDKIVILWSTINDTFYMVLSASGEVITPATSLDGLPLNSFESPIYHNGTVSWAAVNSGRLRIYSIEIEEMPDIKEPTWGMWSDWSTQYISSNASTQVETKNQYSYRTYETTTSSNPYLSGWNYSYEVAGQNDGTWSAWSTNYISPSCSIQVESKTQYSYRDTTKTETWGAWSDWTTTEYTKSESRNVETSWQTRTRTYAGHIR